MSDPEELSDNLLAVGGRPAGGTVAAHESAADLAVALAEARVLEGGAGYAARMQEDALLHNARAPEGACQLPLMARRGPTERQAALLTKEAVPAKYEVRHPVPRGRRP